MLSFGAIFTCQVVKICSLHRTECLTLAPKGYFPEVFPYFYLMLFRPYPAKDAIVIATRLIKVKQVKSKHIHTRLTCGQSSKEKAAACLLCRASSHSKLTIRFQHEYKQAREKAVWCNSLKRCLERCLVRRLTRCPVKLSYVG